MSRKITCPYCFGEFDDDQVAFRSMTVYQDEDDITADVTGGKYDDYISLQQDDILSAKYNDTIEARKRLFIAGRSDKFNRFWRDFANSEMPEPEWIGQHKDFIQYAFERPVIDKMNGGVKSLHKDNDDFVTGATDFCGNDTFDRVCPHCNNPIPSGYGKYDVKHICLIGLRGSGKTVFLSMFLKKFRAVCEKHGIIISVAAMGLTADFLERNLIKMGGDWPSATSPANLEQPLTFQITTNKKTTTFVFHDIAGENCFNAQGGMEVVTMVLSMLPVFVTFLSRVIRYVGTVPFIIVYAMENNFPLWYIVPIIATAFVFFLLDYMDSTAPKPWSPSKFSYNWFLMVILQFGILIYMDKFSTAKIRILSDQFAKLIGTMQTTLAIVIAVAVFLIFIGITCSARENSTWQNAETAFAVSLFSMVIMFAVAKEHIFKTILIAAIYSMLMLIVTCYDAKGLFISALMKDSRLKLSHAYFLFSLTGIASAIAVSKSLLFAPIAFNPVILFAILSYSSLSKKASIYMIAVLLFAIYAFFTGKIYDVNDSVSVSSIFLILIALMTQLVSLVPLQIRNNLVEKHSEIIIEHELISEAQEAGESKKDDEVEAVEVNETSENVSLQKSKPSLYIIPIGIAECAMAFFISLYISRI